MTGESGGPPLFDVPFFMKGSLVDTGACERLVAGGSVRVRMPDLVLDEAVYRRHEVPPAADVPMAEIIDLLDATGRALAEDTGGHLERALRFALAAGTTTAEELERLYGGLHRFFWADGLWAEVDLALGVRYDGWCDVKGSEQPFVVRACAARIVHVLAGNGPAPSVLSIVRGALARGVHLLKLPATDLMAATAVLATMADVAPDHPVVRSFSAVYWPGGDSSIESAVFRAELFDKVAVWGGGAGLATIRAYLGPGLELIAMDPKLSMSLVGSEAFLTEDSLRDAARAAARDVANQELCHNSRYQFVEGGVEQVDRYCAELSLSLGEASEALGLVRVPPELRSEIEVLRHLAPEYRVWGDHAKAGRVVRSESPVDFHPTARTVNVIPVDDLEDAVGFAGPATQVVGIYPASRKAELRDRLAAAGVQRITTLGDGYGVSIGLPHDAMLVLNRMVRWVVASA